MKRIKVTIEALTGFSSDFLGETLFGQICWQIRLKQGEEFLRNLLGAYGEGNPFLIVSDPFPSGCLPVPLFPTNFWDGVGIDLKELKRRGWIRLEELNNPIKKWKKLAVTGRESIQTTFFTHNTIDRITGTTGTGQFSPFGRSVSFYPKGTLQDIYLLLREELGEDVLTVLEDVGLLGFGKDASAGLGKFRLVSADEVKWKNVAGSYLTLSSTDLSGLDLIKPTFYKTKVHFGRHGSLNAISQNPFKKPLLLATRGAVLTPNDKDIHEWLGQGISNVSVSHPEAVHQGYSIVYPLGPVQI